MTTTFEHTAKAGVPSIVDASSTTSSRPWPKIDGRSVETYGCNVIWQQHLTGGGSWVDMPGELPQKLEEAYRSNNCSYHDFEHDVDFESMSFFYFDDYVGKVRRKLIP